MEKPLRLQAFLARAGVGSRRKAEELIRQGRVRVNGRVAVLGQKVNPGDVVEVDGKPVEPPRERIILALHKPRGYTTTRHDPHAQKTVFDLLPDIPGLHPIGRLDRDSEGLLLLTNDGHLTLRLTHPRYGVRKVYRVWTKGGTLPEAVCQRLEKGVVLEDGPARALSCKPAPGGALLTLREGRKREVRRMLQAVGFPVVRLLRLRVGPIGLQSLRPGQYRRLSPKEVRALWAAAGLPGEAALEEGGLEVHGPHPVQEEGVSVEGFPGDGPGGEEGA
ncbi:pseudouridine synthase [Thermus scotoductus]|uniref:Pseudouridine synthase n=1 Tax=Thermus scotoductus TaxID=37636 RepID=A0A430RGM3_THESC|nr:pseudouridine synthase [Thermus scotoductus]RTG98458.1 pseudouridine synthase [Thermus scotoductus]RTH07149.1 pseudouridine synthase [Thermus scotoductus]RTH23427.1 pseudouridine synthase [Thermus scotoductus]RTI02900.1 pseudouridine synthase [Thermus scotoductus]RTI25164.1 pseudouridine synthase [Thermus scotoductus]